jgi:hypothetical protein
MKNSLTLLWVSIAAVILLVFSTGVVSAGETPSFLQVGKSYSVIFGTQYNFTVVEIGNGGWIRVVMQHRHQAAWINTNAVPVIAPYPYQAGQLPR